MKCTWKNCTAAAVHEQIDRDGNVWACLCQAHHDQLYFTVEGLVRSELKLDKFLGVPSGDVLAYQYMEPRP